MGKPTIHGRPDDNHVRTILFDHGHEESRTGVIEVEGAALTFRQSGGVIRSASSAGMTNHCARLAACCHVGSPCHSEHRSSLLRTPSQPRRLFRSF